MTFRKQTNKVLEELSVDMSASECGVAAKKLLAKCKGPDFVAELVSCITVRAANTSRAGERKDFINLVLVAHKQDASAVSADVICTGAEAAITAVSGKADAVPRLVEALKVWSAADVVPVDAYSPPIRDFLATATGGDATVAGAGAGGAGAAGPSALETCVKVASELVAGGAVGIPLAKLAKDAFKGQSAVTVATAVTRAVLQHVHTTGALTKKAAWTSMDALGAVLALFVSTDPAAAAASLQEFQSFFDSIGFPKGVLEASFHRMYENDVMPTEAFIAWKDRVDDTTAKGTALIQLARWFDWLAEEEEDEDEEEEDEDEDSGGEGEDMSDILRPDNSMNLR